MLIGKETVSCGYDIEMEQGAPPIAYIQVHRFDFNLLNAKQ